MESNETLLALFAAWRKEIDAEPFVLSPELAARIALPATDRLGSA